MANPPLAFLDCQPNREKTLLGARYLCREGGMLFVGPSGIGKSSASIQQDILWSLGKPAFGLAPSKPLKIVAVQAEDDEGDIHEMVDGVCKHLDLTPQEKAEAQERCIYILHKSLTGENFIAFIERVLEKHRPDIIRINPLLAYLGGDIIDTTVTAKFLRNGLNPLLEKYQCASIIVHHTPKTNYRNTEEWKAADWAYAAAGSADITNWARAILVMDATHTPGVFIWLAAKRGRRIGWCNEFSEPIQTRYFSHSATGGIHWIETDLKDIPQKKRGGNKRKDVDILAVASLLPELPLDVFRPDFFLQVQQKMDFGEHKARTAINILIERGLAVIIRKSREKMRPAEYLQRGPNARAGSIARQTEMLKDGNADTLKS